MADVKETLHLVESESCVPFGRLAEELSTSGCRLLSGEDTYADTYHSRGYVVDRLSL